MMKNISKFNFFVSVFCFSLSFFPVTIYGKAFVNGCSKAWFGTEFNRKAACSSREIRGRGNSRYEYFGKGDINLEVYSSGETDNLVKNMESNIKKEIVNEFKKLNNDLKDQASKEFLPKTENLQSQIEDLKKQIEDLKSQISNLKKKE